VDLATGYAVLAAFARAQAGRANLLRDIVNAFRSRLSDPTGTTGTVTDIAQSIYTDRAFDRMPVLADTLEQAGCTDSDILAHCRQSGEHVRGCRVVGLLTGKM
jgi:hypothetical protein